VPITVTPSSLDLGADLDCFHYQAIAGAAPANQPLNAALLSSSPAVPSSPSAKLNFSTLFPGCLRTRSTGFQNDLSQTYYTDAGFTSAALPPAHANFGTELQAAFSGIPAGVSVFVQTSLTKAAGSTGLTQLPVTNGSATAIWEVQSADPTQTGTFSIPVYFAFQSGVPAPANISVVQSLASPSGGVAFVQPPPSLLSPILFTVSNAAPGVYTEMMNVTTQTGYAERAFQGHRSSGEQSTRRAPGIYRRLQLPVRIHRVRPDLYSVRKQLRSRQPRSGDSG
jgi:hypothetical protein